MYTPNLDFFIIKKLIIFFIKSIDKKYNHEYNVNEVLNIKNIISKER